MVTFVCQYCDVTLKKKQVEGHIRGRCAPGAVICIDCSQTFYDGEHKGHTNCISEQQKHWGQFAKPKKTKPIQKQQKQDKKINQHKQEAPKLQKQQISAPKIPSTLQQDNKQQNKWKGWKNEIKKLIRQSQNQIQKEKLRRKLKKVYKKKMAHAPLAQQQFQQVFNDKISKIQQIRQVTYFVMDEQQQINE